MKSRERSAIWLMELRGLMGMIGAVVVGFWYIRRRDIRRGFSA
jgi:hypothetical protein